MGKITIAGLLMCWGSALASVLLEGGHLGSFVALCPFILVFGGTLGAVLITLSTEEVKDLKTYIMLPFKGRHVDLEALVGKMVELVTIGRREGLLALESHIEAQPDPFMRKGLQLVIDGIDAETLFSIMEEDIATRQAWYKDGEEIFTKLGGFAPTLGIIGTVLGLVHMLSKLEDPGTMGPAIAAAFIATLYGVSSANLIFLPLGNKLKKICQIEVAEKRLVLQGLFGLQGGESPRVLEIRLRSFLHEPAGGAGKGKAAGH
ncbi:MAG: hypothetical protein A3K19_19455 [Lentisphaerae bacterium RIFOXYB12_FULL_65_16]|nr:MAG: hypothetical protein A3K18_31360 [Lentisphaerae bacterium RIFOXYA12_64_32]OGV92039.1 MAG: hypothetical protein A3K19_19455 [Lentisphaerae bacterium RIFOXYB12_FULL_65_16]